MKPRDATVQPYVIRSAVAAWEQVRDDLKLAIEARGLVVDHESHIQRMLERTGKDVGSTRSLYREAVALSFCSAALSRKMMEADPMNVVFCPYSIVAFVRSDEPSKVHVGYRRPWRPDGSAGSRAALQDVEKLLDSIAREALGLP